MSFFLIQTNKLKVALILLCDYDFVFKIFCFIYFLKERKKKKKEKERGIDKVLEVCTFIWYNFLCKLHFQTFEFKVFSALMINIPNFFFSYDTDDQMTTFYCQKWLA